MPFTLFKALVLLCSTLSLSLPVSGQAAPDSALYTLPRNVTQIQIQDDLYGLRNVSYFVTSNGNAIIDGDVLYGTEAELLSRRVRGNTTNPRPPARKRAFSVFGSRGWPGGSVLYKYDSCDTEKTLSTYVDIAISRWQSKSPYINFVQLPSSATNTRGVLTISSRNCDGCHASIGYRTTGALTMNLQQPGGSCSPGFCRENEATHEFGHVLGLLHEHQRPDRDQTVRYDCSALDPSPLPLSTDCCMTDCPRAGNFDIVSGQDSSGPYDVGSIMQYRRNGFARSGQNTLMPARSGVVVPASNPSNPSTGDYDRICKLYTEECSVFGVCKAPPGSGTCQQCNPIAGQNRCDVSTSCIGTTMGKFYCACEAGKKANAPNGDVTKHFRLPFPNYEFLVFVAPGVQCNTPCQVSQGAPSDLCQEVAKHPEC